MEEEYVKIFMRFMNIKRCLRARMRYVLENSYRGKEGGKGKRFLDSRFFNEFLIFIFLKI